ncbi:hypothetical protein MFLAVUS_009219 [Mucor flavus]|uniref:Uncharacterized protein n=1 Tax=Mucor flavus TaxID=439312 RepID=A0ABP9Z9A5_9FUNG
MSLVKVCQSRLNIAYKPKGDKLQPSYKILHPVPTKRHINFNLGDKLKDILENKDVIQLLKLLNNRNQIVMRVIYSIATVALFALPANAASMKKRDHVDAIDAQIPTVHNLLDAYQAADGYSGALKVRDQELVLLGHMKKAATDCCSVTGIITDEEVDAMLVTVTPVIPKATNALAHLADIKTLYGNTTIIYTCIHDIGSVQHPTYIPVINDYILQLDTTFGKTYSACGI